MAKFTCDFISYTLKRTVDITVIVPTVTIPESMGLTDGKCLHTPDDKYPVLYLFHGMGNNHNTWTGYTKVEMYAEERQIAVVTISAENRSYVNMCGDDFFTFISKELPDFVCGMFPISRDPEHTYIAGLSMGGYGTLVHAFTNPEKFKAFGALSAAVNLNPETLFGDDIMAAATGGANANPALDPSALADKVAADGKKFPKGYIACGEQDFLFAVNEEFRDKLIGLGADITWEQLPEYGHEWRFWDIEIEKFLDWLPRTDAYAGKGRRQI